MLTADRVHTSACFGWSTVLALAMIVADCSRPSTTAARPAASGWKRVGSWSGHRSMQTESFTSDTGGFRVTWETKNESPPGAGRLQVVFHSGDSGRAIMDAVDVRGNGSGTTEVGDRPRWYYLMIESSNLEWMVTVEEPVQLPAR